MQIPVYSIASNAGVDGKVIVDKLLESNNPDIGYDVAKGSSQSACPWSTLLYCYILNQLLFPYIFRRIRGYGEVWYYRPCENDQNRIG